MAGVTHNVTPKGLCVGEPSAELEGRYIGEVEQEPSGLVIIHVSPSYDRYGINLVPTTPRDRGIKSNKLA